MDNAQRTETVVAAIEPDLKPAGATTNPSFFLICGGTGAPVTATAPPTTPTAAGQVAETAQWGLAAFLLSGLMLIVLLLYVIGLILAVMNMASVPLWGSLDRLVASVVMVLLVLLGSAVSAFAVVFALVGWAQARARHLPRPLHAVASLIGIVALVLWLLTTLITCITAVGIHKLNG